MSKTRTLLAGFATLGLLALPAAAQSPANDPAPPRAATAEALLEQIQNTRQDEMRKFQEAVDAFNATPEAERAAKLQGAEAARNSLAAASEALSAQYQENETRILDLNRQLNEKAASLGLSEVFGLSRQVAGDVATILQQSLITAQLKDSNGPPRDEVLRQFASSRRMPVISDLERLWLEIQREMTASGQVARFRTQVVQPTGEAVEADVVRIGPFTALSDGRFLQYLPSLRSLSVLPRQLPGEFMGITEDFLRNTDGYSEAVVDPFRGVTLGLYVQRPTFIERIELGEAVGYVIIAVGLAGAAAFLFQLFYLIAVRIAVSRQLKNLEQPRRDNPLGRVLLAFRGDPNRIEEDADIAELRIAEAVLREVPKLERFQAFLRLAVAAGPLLGLIGTVVGMIITFQSITESGSSDPRLMATGIGQAMIATVLGLGVAIPLLFANALLNSLSRNVVQILDEQSAGMLAESLEKKRGV
ncbi:MAG TPA: MotA/TolQ/ExbB proton channel family protein [Gammaproteobacteria bacterium]